MYELVPVFLVLSYVVVQERDELSVSSFHLAVRLGGSSSSLRALYLRTHRRFNAIGDGPLSVKVRDFIRKYPEGQEQSFYHGGRLVW